ncbi:DUF624 domain-containing protein [Streptomyces sp. VRA16 Mangrove soil]|uniref:DUF624 domain-containing protein n=1 Tax=Streptomyces sp. VRA16 Mangrove soil TaxID=2817434 RepID=UPI001A9E8762|nr:DUF624 domain-containing protein [Streptomyces sp. VRA16 Mangrove soil]MBO1330952.1 DUF624 domain-containing protein [Streptomyces sp. VRA16 Mangrove soil]
MNPAREGRRPRLNVAHSSWESIWSHVHRVLVVNLGIAVTNLPLLAALQLTHQPWRHPVPFALMLLVLPGPSLAAAFAHLVASSPDTEEQAPVRGYFRAYRKRFRSAVLVSAPFALLVIAAVTDAVALRTSAVGAAVVPMAVVVALVALAAWPVALARVAGGAAVTRRLFLLAPYAAVRHPLLTLLNLVLGAVTLLLVNQAPLMGLAVLPGCVLFVVWRNCQVMLSLGEDGSGAAGPVVREAGRDTDGTPGPVVVRPMVAGG